jgi:DedD protein
MIAMASSRDTEITLGTMKLLALFFGLVMICAAFFAFGYTLGRKSEAGLVVPGMAAPQTISKASKPGNSAPTAPSMTFYKSVEQKETNSHLTPPPDSTANQSGVSPAASQTQSSPSANLPDPMAAIPTNGYFVQVAAVSKKDDAEALVDALKKKQYPAFVANNSFTDKLFRVQLGPFGDIKDAEGVRARLINDGYNPILKK